MEIGVDWRGSWSWSLNLDFLLPLQAFSNALLLLLISTLKALFEWFELGENPLPLCLWQGMAFYSLPKRHFFHWAFIGPSSGLCLRIWKSRRYPRQVWRHPRRVWHHPRQVWWGSRAESQNSVISLISPDFARFLQSKNQNTTVPHSMDIQCKKNSLVVQNMCFWCRNRSK